MKIVGSFYGSDERVGLGVTFDCPCGCGDKIGVPFENPVDGGPPEHPRGWQRTGDTIETLTLTPSIQRIGDCAWHGWITNGEARTC